MEGKKWINEPSFKLVISCEVLEKKRYQLFGERKGVLLSRALIQSEEEPQGV